MNIFLARAPWIVGGFVIGLLVVGAWHLGMLEGLTTGPAPTPPTTHQGFPDSGDVAIADQPAGMSALVDSVTVPPPGVWVAIEEVNADGTLGNVLGAARVHGPASKVEVQLLRSTYPGREYAAVLYRDDGDSAFDLAGDSAYIDFDTGARVVELFKTTP